MAEHVVYMPAPGHLPEQPADDRLGTGGDKHEGHAELHNCARGGALPRDAPGAPAYPHGPGRRDQSDCIARYSEHQRDGPSRSTFLRCLVFGFGRVSRATPRPQTRLVLAGPRGDTEETHNRRLARQAA